MTQEQALILAFKVIEVTSVAAIAAFVACYSRWAAWWRNAIGRTIVIKDLALILTLLPSILSIFWHFNRLTSHIAGWFDVAAFALVPAVMVWRTVVFWKIHKAGKMPQDGGPGNEEAP